MRRAYFIFVLFAVSLSACYEPLTEIPEETVGLAPVYAEGEWQTIESGPPQGIVELNKIYYKDSLIFVGEAQRGIHVIDNRDPAQPEPIAFISITGNSDIAIKGNVLFANNLSDLVALDISDVRNVSVISRTPGVFPASGLELPAGYTGFFECPDPNMGSIVGWSEKNLIRPECWR
ncbi:LVIVD repeat-containing protein [Phaeodactylibacter luteus]|uniref:Uncharacterized protein n=1 Tax=Phaeodactylibacter luteus TaxID=1564516 RepID=A0A5C6RW45_9BACT|nr:hypothetical protein [Phaeodactylibacter luteus]TXB66337.1 hypothetical protein FRY97_05855 [Phaeodactylibacter luteus]